MHRSILKALADVRIDLMLMEGTHAGSSTPPVIGEYAVEESITKLIRNATGLVLASFSPQHLDRFVTFIRASIRTRRKLVVDLYSAFVLHLLRNELPIPSPEDRTYLRVLVPKNMARKFESASLANLKAKLEGSLITVDELTAEAQKYVVVFRPSMLVSDFRSQLPASTTCIYSRWQGYLEQEEWLPVMDALQCCGGEIHTEHTSGHISQSDILSFVKAISPELVVPMHTFAPDEFKKWFANARVLGDGECIEV